MYFVNYLVLVVSKDGLLVLASNREMELYPGRMRQTMLRNGLSVGPHPPYPEHRDMLYEGSKLEWRAKHASGFQSVVMSSWVLCSELGALCTMAIFSESSWLRLYVLHHDRDNEYIYALPRPTISAVSIISYLSCSPPRRISLQRSIQPCGQSLMPTCLLRRSFAKI